MRDNLIFTRIPEQRWEDTEQVLQNFLQNKYKLDYRIGFEKVNRIGKWNEFSVHLLDREFIRLNASKRLKSSQVFVNEQFPAEIEEKRK